MLLAVEISRLPNIDCVMWLLVVTLLLVYNEKGKHDQTITFETKICLKEIRRCGIKRVVPLGQQSVQITCKK